MSRFDTIATYIMASKHNGVLYLGVTSDLITRVSRHRLGEACAFTAKYKCRLLVWYEVHASMRTAIQREASLKRYLRRWKVELIEKENPHWDDLWPSIVPQPLPGRRLTIEQFARGERLKES